MTGVPSTSAETLTRALGGRWHGSYGTAYCPAHDDHDPSLSVSKGQDGKLLVKCHADCDQGVVWAALQDLGHVERAGGHRTAPRRRAPPPQPSPEPSPNQNYAIEILRASRPAAGTPAETYLRSRGNVIPVPPTIRFHPALKHADLPSPSPCLVAAACDGDRRVTGIQRIYLTHDGRKAPVNRPKMALGTLRGSAVRLAPTTDRVWLTEGVEDGLAVVQMMGEPAWALLGTANFKSVVLPDSIRQVILAPDGDDAGQGVIQETAIRLAGQGREVRVAKLPAGKDWCDVLDDYEERAGILEFEMEQFRPEAEALARREVIDG